MTQPFCHVCYGTSLTFENGVLVCDTCGTQTQTFQEEAEFQAGVDDTRGKRRAAGSSTAGQQSHATLLAREEERATEQLQIAAFAYVKCLQELLQVQAEWLTTQLGVSDQVSVVLRQLWLSHLPCTGMLEPTPCQPAATAAGLSGQQVDATPLDEPAAPAEGAADAVDEAQAAAAAAADEAQPQPSTTLVVPHNMKRLFWKVTLQLCFLACCLLREALTVYDVIALALDGQLPFLALPHIASDLLTEAESSALPVRCIQPEVALSPLAMYNSCCRLAHDLGVQLPCVAGEAFLLRQVHELQLPQVVLDIALELYSLYLINTPRMQLSVINKAAAAMPHVWLSSLVIVALKLLYGLGNASGQVPLIAKAPPPPCGWHAWAQQVLQHLPSISHMPLTEQQVLALDSEGKQQYIQYCRQYVFAGQPCVPTFEDVQRVLSGWYDSSTQPDMQPQPTTAREAQPGAGAELNLANKAVATDVSRGISQNPSQQQSQGLPVNSQQEAGVAHDVPGLIADMNTAAASSDMATYCVAARGSGPASSMYRLGPQLAAIVVVTAAYSRCTPTELLDCLHALEKQMVAVEAGVRILKQLQGNAFGQVASVP